MSLSTTDLPQMNMLPSTYVLGIRVDRLTQVQALEVIDTLVTQQRASTEALPCQQVVTVNPEFLMTARRNPVFKRALNEAALVVADGMGIVWATRYLREPAPERVTGVDMLRELAGLCARKHYRLYLLGAAPGVAETTAARLQELAPGLEIAGTYAGSPAESEQEEIIARIAASHADVLCVAYGAPAQELWIWRNRIKLPVAVAMGVGGAYDFLSGRQRRAPLFMRKVGLEWLYRLYREPWRWRRMLALPQAAILVLLKGRQA